MNDFLNFLNTAEADKLIQTPGISRPLAESLIAARPFETAEDCLKARGMGKALLTRLQAAFEAQNQPDVEESAPPEESRAALAAPATPPAPNPPAEPSSTFGERMGKAALNFFRAFVRLILTLAFIAALAAAAYYGLPYLNQKLIVPVEKNTAQIEALQTQTADLQNQMDATNAQVSALQADIEAHTASLTKLEEMQAALEKEVSAQNNSVMLALEREVKFTRAVEMLARARLYLSQSNFGLAKTDVQSARDLLAELKTTAPAAQTQPLNEILARLDLALGNLPDLPVIAADDVNIAWELMMRGLPQP